MNFAWYWKKQEGGIVCVGRAHEGMAIAAENILDLVREQLHQAVRYSYKANIYNYQQELGNSLLMFSELPDYRVVLLGYSLGAGVVPLIALSLLQVLLIPHHSLSCRPCYGYSNPSGSSWRYSRYCSPGGTPRVLRTLAATPDTVALALL